MTARQLYHKRSRLRTFEQWFNGLVVSNELFARNKDYAVIRRCTQEIGKYRVNYILSERLIKYLEEIK